MRSYALRVEAVGWLRDLDVTTYFVAEDDAHAGRLVDAHLANATRGRVTLYRIENEVFSTMKDD